MVKSELAQQFRQRSLACAGTLKEMQVFAQSNNVPIDEPVIKDVPLNILRKKLQEKGLNEKGDKKALRERRTAASMPTKHEEDGIQIGWIGSPKGALQTSYERGWINLSMPIAT